MYLIPAYPNEKGTSIVEILLAMVLVAIIFSGLVKTSILVANKNVDNLVRDEAVSLAEQEMNEARDTGFTALVSNVSVTTRAFRGVSSFQFNTQRTVTPLGANNKQVDITVTWTRKGSSYNHTISTVVRK